jgi:transcriptional regulator with XRE-family HTH domain
VAHTIHELDELNAIRLEDDLTYRQLEKLTGISLHTLHQLLTSENPRPFDRTLHKIRRFLDARKRGGRRRAS